MLTRGVVMGCTILLRGVVRRMSVPRDSRPWFGAVCTGEANDEGEGRAAPLLAFAIGWLPRWAEECFVTRFLFVSFRKVP